MLRVGDRQSGGRLVRERPIDTDGQWRDFYASLPEEVRAQCTAQEVAIAISFPFRMAARMCRAAGGYAPVLRVQGLGEFAPNPYWLRRTARRYEAMAASAEASGLPGDAAVLRRLADNASRSFEAGLRRREARRQRLEALRAKRRRKRDGEGDDA